MKRFWTYIKHKRSESSGVAPLRSDGILHYHPVDQANILNKQFQSGFSTKDTYSPDEFNTRCKMWGQYPPADELDITENGVLKLLRDRPFNLKGGGGGVMVFCVVQKFLSDNTRIRIIIVFVAQSTKFFQKLNIRLYDNTLNQIIFFPPPKSEYFFQQHWESEYFCRKKPYPPPPPPQVKWSFPYKQISK